MLRFAKRWGPFILTACFTIAVFVSCIPKTENPRFVDDDNNPIVNAEVLLLCYATSDATGPGQPERTVTNAAGRPVEEMPAGCGFVKALRLWHEQPSGKSGHGPAYRVYQTSFAPEAAPASAAGDIVISRDNPLVLFNIVASVAWEPESSVFLEDLQTGLQKASEFLYDVTDGLMAFGPPTIHIGGQNWDGADFRFLAANDYRPTAFVGGIVAAPMIYSELTGIDVTYAPGAVFLGRFWDGATAETGNWSAPNGHRTLIHEWAHYALFLFDQYQDESGVAVDCLSSKGTDLEATIMDNHYTASEFWEDGVHGSPPPGCDRTDQWRVHGESDWATLDKWPAIQGLAIDPVAAPSALADFPEDPSLIAGLFAGGAALPTAVRAVAEPMVEIVIEDAVDTAVGLPLAAQVYTLEEVDPAAVLTAADPNRILHQGAAATALDDAGGLGSITLLGVDTKADRMRVFVDVYARGDFPGGRFIFPDDSEVDEIPDTAVLHPDEWQSSLNADYKITDGIIEQMTVTVTSLNRDLKTDAVAQLCVPDAAVGCPTGSEWQQPLVPVGGDKWTAVFTPLTGSETLPLYGVVRVQAPGAGEIIRWFQVSGGVGPGHHDGLAPLRDGSVTVNAVAPIENAACNQVVIMPAHDFDALAAPLPSDQQGIIGAPFDIDILLDEAACSDIESDDRDHDLSVPVVVSMTFDKTLAEKYSINPENLRLLHYSRAGGGWIEVTGERSANQLTEEGLIATTPLFQDGIFALGWVAP